METKTPKTLFLKKICRLQNEKGDTIVTALVGAAIGLIVMSGLVTMITNVFKSQRATVSRDAGRELVNSINALLGDANICAGSFGGSTGGGNPNGPNGFTVTKIKDNQPVPIVTYQTGTIYFNNLVKLEGLQVKNFRATGADPKFGTADLVITTSKIGDIIGPKNSAPSHFTLLVTLTAGLNSISTCHSVSGSGAELWEITPSNPLNIFYSKGNVGIGTNNPISTLELNGTDNRAITFTPGTQSQNINFIHNDNGNINARYANITGYLTNGAPGMNSGYLGFFTASAAVAGNPPTVERMRITSEGNVGIGTTAPGLNVGMAGGLSINGTSSTMLTAEKNGASSFALNAGDPVAGAWSMYDFAAPGWLRSITSANGNIGIGMAAGVPDTKFQVSMGNSDRIALYQPADNRLAIQTLLDGVPFATYGANGGAENRLLLQPLVGNVGIGTTTPGLNVGMAGGLSINGTGSTMLTVEKNGASSFALNAGDPVAGAWSLNDHAGVGGWKKSIVSREGNIGIGTSAPASKLDVNGAVKIGNTADACTADNQGALKYGSTAHKLSICDGYMDAGVLTYGWVEMVAKPLKLDTGYVKLWPAPYSTGVTNSSTGSGWKINFNSFSNTLSGNSANYVVDVSFKLSAAAGTVLADHPCDPCQLGMNADGGLDSSWLRLTDTSVDIDGYTGTKPAIVRVRVRIFEY